MKRNSWFIFIFVCLFFFNFSWVSARNEKGGGASSAFGVSCVYSGSRSWSAAKSTTAGGGSVGGDYPYVYTLWVHCNNPSCSKLSVSGYGLIKNKDDDNTEIVIDNKGNLSTMVNSNSDKFGFIEGSGVTKCPSHIGFEFPHYLSQAGMLKNVEKFGNLLINDNVAGPSLESYDLLSIEEARNYDLRNLVKDLMKDRNVVITDVTGEGENATTRVIDAGENKGLVESVIRYAEKYLGSDNFDDLSGDVTCEDLLGTDNIKLLSTGFLILSVIGVLLLVITGFGDFISAITSNEDDAVLKAFSKFKTRIIACVILFLLPAFINFLLGFINDSFYYETTAGQGSVIKVGNVSDCGIGN